MIPKLGLFDAFGVEVEYMVVDRESLAIRPIVPELFAEVTGHVGASDYIDGKVAWSNELVAHVVELKASEPVSDLRILPPLFEKALARIDRTLKEKSAILLPTAMHPSMNPATETVLWPYENHEIYEAFDRVFNCRRHGWANVQSVHLNLPFNGDDEFARLHAAVRLVLPLLPALAASSPIVDSQRNGINDNRLIHYREHCSQIPSIAGDVIPEPIYDEATYRREIFERIFADILPYDPDGILSHEFLNARGAIARFDRGSIEIRLMDVQECPMADVAISAGVVAVVRALVAETWQSLQWQKDVPTAQLVAVLNETISQGGRARIEDPTILAAYGFPSKPIRASILWQNLLERLRQNDTMLDGLFAPLDIIFQHGTLAKRIFRATGEAPSPADLVCVYAEISNCLRRGEPFVP